MRIETPAFACSEGLYWGCNNMAPEDRCGRCEPDKFATFFPIETAPTNTRLLIFGKMPEGHDEMAMAWKDLIDGKWYFAPQGGLIPFIPTQWCYVPTPTPSSSKAD